MESSTSLSSNGEFSSLASLSSASSMLPVLGNAPAATHDTSRIGWHMEDLAALAANVEAAVSASFPNHGGSRYRSVNVGMMRWESQTAGPFEAGIEHEFGRLGDVFEKQYGFNVEDLVIQATGRSHNALMSQALAFIEDYDSKENLFILYYAGHGYINDYRQSTWAFSQTADSPTVDWSHIQGLFERAESDVLVILDCCAAASAAASAGPKEGAAFMETIAACGFEGRAPPPGEHSFTTSLIEVLEDWVDVPAFSVSMLHSEVFRVVMQRRREKCSNGQRLEWRSTPVYVNNSRHAREIGIELCKRGLIDVADFPSSRSVEPVGSLLRSPDDIAPSTYLDLMSLNCEALDNRLGVAPPRTEDSTILLPDDHETDAPVCDLKLPHMLISVELDQDQSLPSSEACRRWISSFPGFAKYVRVEGVYRSYSTVMVLSIPIVIWNSLPDHPACRPITYVTSKNLLGEHDSERSSSAVSIATPESRSCSESEFCPVPHETKEDRTIKASAGHSIPTIEVVTWKSHPITTTLHHQPRLEYNNAPPSSNAIANTSKRRTGYILPERKRHGIPLSDSRIARRATLAPQDSSKLSLLKSIAHMSGMRYSYSPLGPEDDIRILRLQSGSSDDPVKCQLISCAFPSRQRMPDINIIPEYEALSYTWGPDPPSEQIMILTQDYSTSHVQEGRYLYIRPTLHAALVQLRSLDEPVALWVDALCINQEDCVERSEQVSKMHQIYSEAKNVCIWLGHGDTDFDTNKQSFDFIRQMLDLRRLDHLVHAEDQASNWLDFVKLLQHRWFTRIWTVQELALAKEATVHVGNEVIQWSDFADATALFIANYNQIATLFPKNIGKSLCNPTLGDLRALSAKTLVETTSNLFRTAKDGTSQRLLSLEVLVSTLLTFESADPRDTIYAVLSLAKDTVSSKEEVAGRWMNVPNVDQRVALDTRIVPNYSKSLVDTCTDFIDFCIDKSKSVDIICRPWVPETFDHKTLPSWIPTRKDSAFGEPGIGLEGRVNGDSFVGTPNHNGHNYHASAGLNPFAIVNKRADTVSHHPRLFVKGIMYDVIDELAPRAIQGVVPEEGLSMGGWKYDSAPERVPDTLWRTLVADRGLHGMSPPSWYYRACLESLMSVTPNGDLDTVMLAEQPSTPSTVVLFLKRVQEVVWNRKFFLSAGRGTQQQRQKKLFGLAPTKTKLGDTICILFGCSVPVILRRVCEEDDVSYKLIGEAYIHGMMDGEALAGERPEYPYDDYETFVLR